MMSAHEGTIVDVPLSAFETRLYWILQQSLLPFFKDGLPRGANRPELSKRWRARLRSSLHYPRRQAKIPRIKIEPAVTGRQGFSLPSDLTSTLQLTNTSTVTTRGISMRPDWGWARTRVVGTISGIIDQERTAFLNLVGPVQSPQPVTGFFAHSTMKESSSHFSKNKRSLIMRQPGIC